MWVDANIRTKLVQFLLDRYLVVSFWSNSIFYIQKKLFLDQHLVSLNKLRLESVVCSQYHNQNTYYIRIGFHELKNHFKSISAWCQTKPDDLAHLFQKLDTLTPFSFQSWPVKGNGKNPFFLVLLLVLVKIIRYLKKLTDIFEKKLFAAIVS